MIFFVSLYRKATINKTRMNHDIPQPVPQGSDGTQTTENSRILAYTDELRGRCEVYEAELRDSTQYVNR